MAAPGRGDVLIRTFVGSSLQLVDAGTLEQICIVPSVDFGIRIGADQCVAVWREHVDRQGNTLGTTLLWWPTPAVPRNSAGPTNG